MFKPIWLPNCMLKYIYVLKSIWAVKYLWARINMGLHIYIYIIYIYVCVLFLFIYIYICKQIKVHNHNYKKNRQYQGAVISINSHHFFCCRFVSAPTHRSRPGRGHGLTWQWQCYHPPNGCMKTNEHWRHKMATRVEITIKGSVNQHSHMLHIFKRCPGYVFQES